MPSDEEKEQDGLGRHFQNSPANPETPGAGPEEAPELSAAPASEPGEDEEAPQEPPTGAEKKEKRFWPLALLLTLLVLGGGGFYALTGLKDTAHKLGGGSEYDQLAANSSVYDGKAGGYRQLDVFSEGEGGPAAAAGSESADRLNPALAYAKGELEAETRSGSSQSSRWQQDEDQPGNEDNASAAAPQNPGLMAKKLRTKASFSRGPGVSRSKAGAAGSAAGFEGSGTLVGKGSAQRETKDKDPKKASKGGVMESLKGAFKASLYGARLSSQDSAKSWISRAFDATPEADMAIEYDEKVRSKLDRVNPDSIPSFLRDQDVTAAEAKRLADSKVSKPKMDKDGTADALDGDKDYQKKKMANDFASSMINGLFAGISGTGSEEKPDDKSDQGDDDGGWGAMDYGGDTQGYGGYADPEDTQTIVDTELQDWVDMNGFGGECGCTADAPCCCLPGSGAGTTEGSMIGDFPDMGGDTMFA